MKSAVTSLNRLILAGLLAAGASAVMAQAPAAAPPPPASAGTMMNGPGGQHMMMGQRDPAKMQAQIAKHQADMKALLKITPAQEAVWSRYTAAMQPPAHAAPPTREQRAELDKLPTPERIDKMHALRTERMTEMNAAMDKRDEATKALYAALTPEQQKTFDAQHSKPGQRPGAGAGEGPNPHAGHMPPPKN
jgi:Spy/CpxP family protein refolding chaperone